LFEARRSWGRRLITEAQDHPQTLVGSPDYMDVEVHGSLAGDLYSFGKVYVMATGHPPSQCPGLPRALIMAL
jgi:serine/threonine protein kinase